jgi:transposase
METGYFHMSQKELERLKVIDKVLQRELSQIEASRQLKVTSRQIRRLLACYKEHGAAGLISKHRNKPGNHRKPTGVKQQVISLIKEKYSDFGPTLASEYLEKSDNIKLSSETVRLWMISEGLWQPKNKKGLKRVHQHRERRSQFGELIQLDGSPHDWFEGRANKCCLLVIIDDATSALLGLRFCHAETTQDYFALMDSYIKAYGLPMSAYTDKHGIFRINDKRHEGARLTQFGRALNELGVELIHASSPQAKGRVERVNKTLQDRLIKWLRLKKISTMEDANKVLNEYILEHNTKFAKPAKNKANAHIAVTETPQKLKHILSVKTEKKLSKSLSFQHEKKLYQIKEKGKWRLQNKQVILIESYDGESAIYHNEKQLEFGCIEVQTKAGELHDEKTINHAIDELKTKASSEFTPGSSNEPWNDYKIIEKQIAFSS